MTLIVAVAGPDASHFAAYYVEKWRSDGSAVVSPFLSDFGVDRAVWRADTLTMIDAFDARVVVAPLSDSDAREDHDEARRLGDENFLFVELMTPGDFTLEHCRTSAALRIEAFMRRGETK
jgi:hypothetical protein